MKTKIYTFVLFLLFPVFVSSQTIPFLNENHFKTLNFECGGYVTAVYPAYMNNSTDLGSQWLYAKTDVGGVYKSTNNGNNWTLISNYYHDGILGFSESMFFSHYVIAGLAVNPTEKEKLILAWGSWKTQDYTEANGKCVLYSVNGGATWEKSKFYNINQPNTEIFGPRFDGDVFEDKIGGECISYHPEGNIIYIGGYPENDNQKTNLFVSSDGGANFYRSQIFENESEVGERILCLAFIKHGDFERLWIGTDKNIYIGESINGNGFPGTVTKQTSIYVQKYFTRILPHTDGSAYVAYTREVNDPNSNGGLLKYSKNSSGQWLWDDLTDEFDGLASPSPGSGNYMSLLSWIDLDVNKIIAGRVNNIVKKSLNGGTNWIGEGGYDPDQIYFRYKQVPNHYPNHQLLEEYDNYFYSGTNFLVRNPNHNYCWYMSGGAGLRMTTNAGTNFTGDIFDEIPWEYKTVGQSMPVVFDISFEPNNNRSDPGMLIPIADWTMAYKNNQTYDFEKLNYDNRKIVGTNSGNTWISEVSRALYKPNDTRISFITGGDAYTDKLAKLYKRTNNSGSIIIENLSSNLVNNTTTGGRKFVCDGLITKKDNNYNNLIVLVGTDQESPPNPSNGLGIFYSANGGNNFYSATFDQGTLSPGVNSNDIYLNSLLPAGYSDSRIPGKWESQFNLAKVPGGPNGNDIIYLYLEKSTNGGGGIFISTNGGVDWFSYSNSNPPVNPPNNTEFGKGCLKYIGNFQLALAIEGGGLFKGTINTTNGSITWESFGGFTSASQVDVYNGKWVVFGKRDNINNDRLFKYTSWPTPDWRLITGRIRGVRSLRIRPNNTNEVWIATTGMGVVVYNYLYSNNFLISKEASVCDNVNINTNTTFDEDVVVENGGQLILQDSAVIQLAEGVKIIVQEGGKLQANNVTFISKSENENWGGIEVENCDSSLTIQNCTFNNATLPIKIINDETTAYSEKIIKNNVFNCESTQDFAIYAENVFNILIQGNQFNMAGEGSQTVGLEVKNNGDYICAETTPKINIVNNTFTDGCASMVLNSYASELSPVYVYGNTFSGSSAAYNIIGRMITGKIKNNNFSGTSTDNPVYLQQCTPDMFRNVINGGGTTMILNGHSYPNLSPVRTSNTYYWYGGQNKLYSSNAGNINVIDAGLPFISSGHNQFSKNSDPLYFHIAGALDSTVETYDAAGNAWCSSGDNPVNYLYTSGNPYVITDFSGNYTCNQMPAFQYTGSIITNMGFGINDTVFISSHTNNYIPPDEILYSQASVYMSGSQFLDAINSYKNLINTYLESQYLNTSLYDIYGCYQGLDTSSNPTYRDNLYSDLKTFLNDKIQSNNYNSEFIDIAYYLVNMCEVNMENYNDALTGFEFIAMFHPDAEMRLLASWDYDEVQDLMGQSGAQKEVTAEQFRKKVLSEIENAMKNDSTMRVVSRMFKQQNEEIDNTYASKTTTSKSGNENNSKIKTDNASKKDNTSKENSKRPNIMQLSKEVREDLMQRAEDNLRALRTMNTERKIKKHKEDILLIAGLTAETEKKIEATSLPLSYSLSQNYPNPFNPVTKINYELPNDGKVKLMIYDVLGREIKTLVNEVKQAGKYTVEFNGHNFASGVYFYRIESGIFMDVKRMVLVK